MVCQDVVGATYLDFGKHRAKCAGMWIVAVASTQPELRTLSRRLGWRLIGQASANTIQRRRRAIRIAARRQRVEPVTCYGYYPIGK